MTDPQPIDAAAIDLRDLPPEEVRAAIDAMTPEERVAAFRRMYPTKTSEDTRSTLDAWEAADRMAPRVRNEQAPGDQPGLTIIEFIPAAGIQPVPVRWAWEGRIAQGELHLVVGVPGLGKTVLAGELAARASRGQLPGDLDGPVEVLIATAEDSLAHTLVPRLTAAGADLDRVHFIAVHRDGLEVGLTLPDDVPALEERVAEVRAGWVIIDPVMAHLADALDSHRDHSIRRALAPLHRLAGATGAAVVGIGHLNKAPTGDVLSRVGGSVGLTAAVRSVLLVAPDPKDPADQAARVLVHAKCNLGPKLVSRRFRVEQREVETEEGPAATAGIVWEGDAPDVTDRDVLAPSASDEERSALEEAVEFLEAALAGGARPSREVWPEARSAGVAERTLKRAKSHLGVVSERIGFGGDGEWWWSLPEGANEAIGGQTQSVASYEGQETDELPPGQAAQGISEPPIGGQGLFAAEGLAPYGAGDDQALDRCFCGAIVERFTGDGTPWCAAHFPGHLDG
ncbi:MAG: AAA family ATPase [Acidimicrobiia bacterium]